MCCSGLLACPEITNQTIFRNIILPLAVAQGLMLCALTRFRLMTVAEGLPTAPPSLRTAELGFAG